jgi:hypothetical protein
MQKAERRAGAYAARRVPSPVVQPGRTLHHAHGDTAMLHPFRSFDSKRESPTTIKMAGALVRVAEGSLGRPGPSYGDGRE